MFFPRSELLGYSCRKSIFKLLSLSLDDWPKSKSHANQIYLLEIEIEWLLKTYRSFFFILSFFFLFSSAVSIILPGPLFFFQRKHIQVVTNLDNSNDGKWPMYIFSNLLRKLYEQFVRLLLLLRPAIPYHFKSLPFLWASMVKNGRLIDMPFGKMSRFGLKAEKIANIKWEHNAYTQTHITWDYIVNCYLYICVP